MLVICNGRRCVSEPEWTRARPSLDQKSVIDYIIITDAQLLRESGDGVLIVQILECLIIF